jgi:hypothetical protein
MTKKPKKKGPESSVQVHLQKGQQDCTFRCPGQLAHDPSKAKPALCLSEFSFNRIGATSSLKICCLSSFWMVVSLGDRPSTGPERRMPCFLQNRRLSRFDKSCTHATIPANIQSAAGIFQLGR